MNTTSALLEQRAILLATVFLTRHPDVRLLDRRDSPYDLDVELRRAGQSRGRMFGVELKARLSLPQVGRIADKTLKLTKDLRDGLKGVQARTNDLPFPLMFLVFAMDSDRGFFGWLREPTTKGRLSMPQVSVAQPWGVETHNAVVDEINHWYDKRNLSDAG